MMYNIANKLQVSALHRASLFYTNILSETINEINSIPLYDYS